MKISKTRTMVECSLLVALALIFRFIPVFSMPLGGSVTIGGMAPLVIASLRHGPRWGVLTSGVYAIIRALSPRGVGNVLFVANLPASPVLSDYLQALPAMAGVVLFDYIVAYAVMGLAYIFAVRFNNRITGACVGAAVTGFLRYLCHVISGVIIWRRYITNDVTFLGIHVSADNAGWIYSFVYNATYMLPEIIITVVVVGVVVKVFMSKFFAPPAESSI